jgi:hypothetical protein
MGTKHYIPTPLAPRVLDGALSALARYRAGDADGEALSLALRSAINDLRESGGTFAADPFAEALDALLRRVALDHPSAAVAYARVFWKGGPDEPTEAEARAWLLGQAD